MGGGGRKEKGGRGTEKSIRERAGGSEI